MSEILRELSRSRDELLGLSFRQTFVIIGIVFALGIYVGGLLFGVNSLEVYMNLDSREASLKEEVEYLRVQNAKLQKDYFELKTLEPK
ncbi:MAG: hypothetical protein ACLFQJ_06045 [Campylobacterales bacterium]